MLFRSFVTKSNNLSDLDSASTALTNLGIANHDDITVDGSGNVGVGTSSPSSKLEVNGTVTATSYAGDGSALTGITGGGPSLGTNSIIRTNAQTISENITIPADTNGMSIGDITVADTFTVTVLGRWVVI